MDQIMIPKELNNYTLKEHSFFQNTVSIQLPDFMKPMSAEEYQMRYGRALKNEVALLSEHGNAVFTFSRTGLAGSIMSISAFIEKERDIFSRIVPGYVELGVGTKNINKTSVGFIQYKSNAIDKDIINVFFAFAADEEIRYGLFAAPYEWQEAWTIVFLTCIETLQLTKGNHQLK